MLTRNQFLVINALREETGITSQAQLAEACGLSVGTVNSTLKGLRDKRWVEARTFALTDSGRAQLEPYKVENAIIMAAGFSSHFAPLSYERPKGLLEVRGEIMIERQIKQLHAVGITDITVVVGYMKELFFYLAEKFNVDIVVNEEYSTRDNHNSLYLTREKLGNTFICSSDNYFTQNPYEPYVYEAYYSAVYSAEWTKEWCMEVKAHDVISKVTIGGENAWYMLGHAYFDKAFSTRFRQILEEEYDLPATRKKLWENMFMEHLDELRMVMRRYPDDYIYEFDSIEDIRIFDPTFIDNVDSTILDNIARVLDCKRADIHDVDPIKTGKTNLSCKFRVGDEWYVYRHPGSGTSRYINRESEAFAEQVAKELDLDSTFIAEDPQGGGKLSHFVDGCEPFDYHNADHVAMAMDIARKLHTSDTTSPYTSDVREVTETVIAMLAEHSRVEFDDFKRLHEQALKLSDLFHADGVAPVLCHNDFYAPNYLIHDGRVDVVDWEYAGMGDYAIDLGTFVCCCKDYTENDVNKVLAAYFQREPTAEELRHCYAGISLASFRWYVWALYRDVCGTPVGELLYTWYRYANDYGTRALEMYNA